jgi:hypothetical protein
MQSGNFRKASAPFGLLLGLSSVVQCCLAQTAADPTNGTTNDLIDSGVQSGNSGTGATLINPANDPSLFTVPFQDGLNRFQDEESVSNSPEANDSLGPRFDLYPCRSCHTQPMVSGSGSAINARFQFVRNGATARCPLWKLGFRFSFTRRAG